MKPWRQYIPWMLDDEPWSFVILVPIIGLIVLLCGVFYMLFLRPIFWLLGFKEEDL